MLHQDFIESQNKQIEFANNLIEHANGNENVIRLANELIKYCEKAISIAQNMYGHNNCDISDSNGKMDQCGI